MSIYTKTGDKGETSLYGGTRVGKDDLRVWCYGTVDELGSTLGLVYAALPSCRIKDWVRTIQKKLFIVGAQLASDAQMRKEPQMTIRQEDIAFLENIIDRYTQEFGKATGFTIPGATPQSALLHVARTTARRAERYIVALDRDTPVSPLLIVYINRLSDALYAMARQEVYEELIRRVYDRVMETGKQSAPKTAECLWDRLYNAANAKSGGMRFSFAVADCHGALLYFRRQPGAILESVKVAQDKAYSAAVMGIPTDEIKALTDPGGEFQGLSGLDSRLVTFGGGYPLIKCNELMGAIGVSGGSAAADTVICQAALTEFSVWAGENDKAASLYSRDR